MKKMPLAARLENRYDSARPARTGLVEKNHLEQFRTSPGGSSLFGGFMKVKLTFFLIALLTSAVFAATRDYLTIHQSGTIIIGTDGAFPPFSFKRGSQLTGFEVELANAIAASLAVKTEWRTAPFVDLFAGLKAGKFDFVIASHGITPERQKLVDFAMPHYCTGGMIVSKTDGPKTVLELPGTRIGVQVGTTYMQNVLKVPGVEKTDVRGFAKDSDALRDLIAGKIDVWITDKFVALDVIKNNPKANLEHGDLMFTERIAMAIAKGNNTVTGSLNSALIGLLNDGTYEKISNRWFGEDIRCEGS
jgi:polar amino acid transport system substrate-binding protein